jgi:integrase
MKQKDHPQSDGRRVWLQRDEAKSLLDEASDTETKIAFGLGLRCGLRVAEIVDVKPRDLTDTEAGQYVRVQNGKNDKYRETPVPHSLAETISAYVDVAEVAPDEPIVDRPTRWVQRRVERARDRLRAETGDEGWQYVTPHDLRRTWGHLLIEDDIDRGIVMEWGGWENWSTFREHYLGVYSMQKQQSARDKVAFL